VFFAVEEKRTYVYFLSNRIGGELFSKILALPMVSSFASLKPSPRPVGTAPIGARFWAIPLTEIGRRAGSSGAVASGLRKRPPTVPV